MEKIDESLNKDKDRDHRIGQGCTTLVKKKLKKLHFLSPLFTLLFFFSCIVNFAAIFLIIFVFHLFLFFFFNLSILLFFLLFCFCFTSDSMEKTDPSLNKDEGIAQDADAPLRWIWMFLLVCVIAYKKGFVYENW